ADGPFSVPAIAALLGGIGFGGAAATAVLPEALPDGVTVLLPPGGGRPRPGLVGPRGVVVSAVPSPGYGEVRLALAGQQLKYAARSDAPLPPGTPVYLVEALSDTAVQVVSTAPDPMPEILPEPGGTHP